MPDETALQLPAAPGPPASESVTVSTPDGKSLVIGGKLKRLVDAMVWDGMPWSDAARQVGFNGRAARRALEKPHVISYIRAQRATFRAALSARNETVLVDVRDNSKNSMARVAATKAIDQLEERSDPVTAGRHLTPGIVVQIGVRTDRQIDETIIQVGPTARPDMVR